MRIKLSIITALFLSLCLQHTAWAAPQIQATVSDNSVFLGDLFQLTISIDDNDSDFQLDTEALEKDFHVSRPSQSRRSSYINGKSSQQTQWQVTLQAKRLGELTIPALRIGKLTTDEIKISVQAPSQQASSTAGDLLFMENSLDKSTAYIGQPLLFTSRIYIARNTDDLQLLAPTLENATVSLYAEDKSGETIRNGIRYQTITRQFQIIANKAGTFTIQSPLLTGSLRKTVAVDGWRSRTLSEPINIRGDSLQVTIKGKPADYQGEWLVSEDVQLFENPAISEKSYRAGEPITRTITLQVASIDKDKLPNIDFNYPKNLRFYPDQDELTEGQAKGLHYAQRTMRHAIIADQPGQLKLPEIKLAWWNSQTDKQEFAVLPAQTLTILAAAQPAEETRVNKTEALAENKTLPARASIDNKALMIWQFACALLLLALIMLSFYHLNYRRAQQGTQNKNKKTAAPAKQAYVKLQQEFAKQQPALAYRALLHYAQSEFPALKSLSQLPEQMHLNKQDKAQCAAAIKTLETACASPSTSWDSTALSTLLKKHQQQKGAVSRENIMTLNPA